MKNEEKFNDKFEENLDEVVGSSDPWADGDPAFDHQRAENLLAAIFNGSPS